MQGPEENGRERGTASAINFPAVAKAKDEDEQPIVLDFANQAIIANAILPELS